MESEQHIPLILDQLAKDRNGNETCTTWLPNLEINQSDKAKKTGRDDAMAIVRPLFDLSMKLRR